MEWPKLMGMNWGTVPWLRTQGDIEAAAGEIRSTINRHPPDNDELCEVIRWLAGPENEQEKAPTLRELIRAIFVTRKIRRSGARVNAAEDRARDLDERKDRMRTATPEDRWDIACEADCTDDVDDIRTLMEWARTEGLEVVRPRFEPVSALLGGIMDTTAHSRA